MEDKDFIVIFFSSIYTSFFLTYNIVASVSFFSSESIILST